MNKSYLITGGVRSGKSSFALNLADQFKCPFIIATGFAGDNEMYERIEKHKLDRPFIWQTIEEQIHISDSLMKAKELGADFILIDCITMWLCNLMMKKLDYNLLLDQFIETIKCVENLTIAIVSNETGMGIVPQTQEGREFRDIQGFVNQKIAKNVSNVIFMVSGLPLYLKTS